MTMINEGHRNKGSGRLRCNDSIINTWQPKSGFKPATRISVGLYKPSSVPPGRAGHSTNGFLLLSQEEVIVSRSTVIFISVEHSRVVNNNENRWRGETTKMEMVGTARLL